MSETVMACPECDSAALDRRTTSGRDKWVCRECPATFREPIRRAAKQPGERLSGLPKRLSETDTEVRYE